MSATPRTTEPPPSHSHAATNETTDDRSGLREPGAGAVTTYRLTAPDGRVVACRAGAAPLARLELLFGMGKKDGSEVSDAEWRAFLDAEVSPRFPMVPVDRGVAFRRGTARDLEICTPLAYKF